MTFAHEGAPNEDPNEIEAKAIELRDKEWLDIINQMVAEAYTVSAQTGAEAWHLVCIQFEELKTRMAAQ